MQPDWSLWSSSDWKGQVLVHWSKEETRNPLLIVDSGGITEQGIVLLAVSSVGGSSQYTEHVRSPCPQMAARLLLVIKFEPSVDHGESISADKLLLRVHIK